MKDCVSLEVAQKLQKAGWKGETEYYWERRSDKVTLIAPTATELAEELPRSALGAYLNIFKDSGGWRVGYGLEVTCVSKTLPDALGLMMCYLLENKLI